MDLQQLLCSQIKAVAKVRKSTAFTFPLPSLEVLHVVDISTHLAWASELPVSLQSRALHMSLNVFLVANSQIFVQCLLSSSTVYLILVLPWVGVLREESLKYSLTLPVCYINLIYSFLQKFSFAILDRVPAERKLSQDQWSILGNTWIWVFWPCFFGSAHVFTNSEILTWLLWNYAKEGLS